MKSQLSRSRVAAVALVAASLSGIASAAPAATATVPAAPSAADPGMPPEVVAEYRAAHPGVPAAVLDARLALTYPRAKLLERFVHEHAATFGGSWYDYGTGVWHLLGTTDAALSAMAGEARARGIEVAARKVRYSGAALHARAERIMRGQDPMSRVSTKAGVDIEKNRVLVAAPAARRVVSDPMVTYVDPQPTRGREQACTDRNNCGIPLRSGIILWRQDQNDPTKNYRLCSLGFAARGTDGSLWALTAGHCPTAQDEVWGHGGQYLGRMRQCGHPLGEHPCINTTDVDAARIHITNSYWQSASFGHIFSTPSTYVNVDNAISSKLQIEPGQAVCLTAWHQPHIGRSFPWWDDIDPQHYEDSGDNCGRIVSASDSRKDGMPTLKEASACGGDSGGGWYYWPGNGERWAMGLHRNAENAYDAPSVCTDKTLAWFTSIPAFYIFTDPLTYPTKIRVITR